MKELTDDELKEYARDTIIDFYAFKTYISAKEKKYHEAIVEAKLTKEQIKELEEDKKKLREKWRKYNEIRKEAIRRNLARE